MILDYSSLSILTSKYLTDLGVFGGNFVIWRLFFWAPNIFGVIHLSSVPALHSTPHSTDGSIPPESVPTALRAANLNPSEEVLKDLLREGGKGSQPLDEEGYKKLVSELDDQSDTLESVLEAFRVFDKNLNGTVSTNEFRHIMTSMGEKYTDEEFRELVQGYVVVFFCFPNKHCFHLLRESYDTFKKNV